MKYSDWCKQPLLRIYKILSYSIVVDSRFKILNPNCFHPITKDSLVLDWLWTWWKPFSFWKKKGFKYCKGVMWIAADYSYKRSMIQPENITYGKSSTLQSELCQMTDLRKTCQWKRECYEEKSLVDSQHMAPALT